MMKILLITALCLLLFLQCSSTKPQITLPFTGKGVGVPNKGMSGVVARVTASETAKQRAVDSVLAKLGEMGVLNAENQGSARYCIERWANDKAPKPNYLSDGTVEIELKFDQSALDEFNECAKRQDAF